MQKKRPFGQILKPQAAMALQRRLAGKVIMTGGPRSPRWVCGCDLAFHTNGKQAVAAAVVWDAIERCVVEQRTVVADISFPYIPGLLSFREAPALLKVIRKLKCAPDVFLFDGHGVAHPRGCGLAAHMGVLLDQPAIGCAKSILVGHCGLMGVERGAVTPLFFQERFVGTAVRTRRAVRPIYVSIGHRVSLKRAVDIVLSCGGGFRLPELTRLADRLVARVKTEIW